MAADVTPSLIHRQQRTKSSEILITKDLLGGLSKVSNSESHLGSKEYERCGSPNSPLSSSSIPSAENKSKIHAETNPDSGFQDLNHPPSSRPQINLFLEETCLDLKLQSSTSSHYQSVCTLDKVKSALQRAEKETLDKKRPSPGSLTSAVPPSLSSNSPGTGMFAAGCPGCFLYVITLKTNPKCPRCNATVTSPLAMKKAKIDLNSSI